MKLKPKGKEAPTKSKPTKEEYSRRGRRSRNKGSNYERTIAKKFKEFFGFDLVRTPQSGGFAKKCTKAGEFRGDIVSADEDIDLKIHIECKNTKTWSLPAWLKQAEGDCPKGKKPIVIFHQHGTSNDYVAMKLEDFLSVTTTEDLFEIKR